MSVVIATIHGPEKIIEIEAESENLTPHEARCMGMEFYRQADRAEGKHA